MKGNPDLDLDSTAEFVVVCDYCHVGAAKFKLTVAKMDDAMIDSGVYCEDCMRSAKVVRLLSWY